ncbi:MAG: tetratricopeptide repeat protein [bacterium]|nr:tetratricopeptide repeat protein [bacterium]
MALDKKRKHAADEPEEQLNDLEALAKSVREHPALYAATMVFIIACVIAGFAYKAFSVAREQSVATQYVRAMDAEEDADRVAELEPVARESAESAVRALYMLGETALKAGGYEKATASFTELREKHPESPFTPQAVEGLGYIAEEQGNLEDALKTYQEVVDNWPGSLAARRQHLNMARIQERLEQYAEAVASYREQLTAFPESTAAKDAQQALTRLEASYPDLFPEEEPMLEAPAEAAAEEALETPELTLAVPEEGVEEDAGDESDSMDDAPALTQPADLAEPESGSSTE